MIWLLTIPALAVYVLFARICTRLLHAYTNEDREGSKFIGFIWPVALVIVVPWILVSASDHLIDWALARRRAARLPRATAKERP